MNREMMILFVLGFLGLALIVTEEHVTDYVYTPIVNNTDLAPEYGTGERIGNITYYANETPLDIFIYTHNPVPTEVDIDLYIDGVRVQDDDVRTTVVNNNRSKWIHIPYKASYAVNLNESGGLHHYEWREYKYAWVKK